MLRNRTKKAIALRNNMQIALQLRAHGYSYERIGKALNPSVSRQHAWRLVERGLKEVQSEFKESAQNLVELELLRLNRMMFTLWTRSDPSKPKVVDTLLKISDRICRLLGLYAPKRIAVCQPDGTPVPAKTPSYDFSKLSVEELQTLDRLQRKMAGEGQNDRN